MRSGDAGLGEALQALLDRAVAEAPGVRGGLLRVDLPGFAWCGASGLARVDGAIEMHPDDQFQVASITKMLTATAVLRLVEEGRAALDAPISTYLPAAVTAGLHVWQGHDYGPELTLRQLLGHTSGIADYFGDGEADAGGVLPFVRRMRENPDRLWQPLDLLAFARSELRPHGAPSTIWHYADTGFVLAGLVIEALIGQPLHDALRNLLFDPLGMRHSWMLFREPARPSLPGRGVSDAFAGDAPYGRERSVTADWAGGGVVTTTSDLARFIGAFADGRVIREPRTRDAMLSWTATGEPGIRYGLGVRGFVLDELGLPGSGELLGHTGFLKSFMLYWPKHRATICGTLNQSAAPGAWSQLRPVAALVPAVLATLEAAGR